MAYAEKGQQEEQQHGKIPDRQQVVHLLQHKQIIERKNQAKAQCQQHSACCSGHAAGGPGKALFPGHGQHGAADDHDLLQDQHEHGRDRIAGIIARGIVQQPGIDASPHLQGQRRAFRYALFAQALHAGPCAQAFRGQPPSLYQHAVGQ